MRKGHLRYPTSALLAVFNNLSAAEAAIHLGITRSTVVRWRNPKATLNQWDADRYAVKIGKHPGEIWADWFDIDC